MKTLNENQTLYSIELTQSEIFRIERALKSLSNRHGCSIRNLDRRELDEEGLKFRERKVQYRAETLALLDKFLAVMPLPEVEHSND